MYQNRLINFGDQALANGFYEIINQNFDCEIISGGRKNFPYFNITKFKASFSSSEIENEFERLLKSLLAKSKKRLGYEQKIFNFVEHGALFNNPFINSINSKFSEKYSKNVTETISPFLFKRSFFENQVKKIQSADIVLCNAGGFLSDHLEFYVPSYLFECYLAKKLGKTVISMNQSISIKKSLNRKMVSVIYKMLDFNMTREPVSADELIEMGVDKNRVVASCDAAFGSDYNTDKNAIDSMVKKNNLGKGGIGLAIRGDRKIDYQKIIHLMKFIKNKFKKKVYFIATCKAHDMPVFKKLSKDCELFYIEDLNDYRLLTQLLKHLDFIITDRYHAVIFSIVAQTPMLAFSPQSIKMEGLFKLFKYPFKVLSLDGTPLKEIEQSLDQINNRKEELSSLLANVYKQMRDKAHNDMQNISPYLYNS